jgi:hypothetical protein
VLPPAASARWPGLRSPCWWSPGCGTSSPSAARISHDASYRVTLIVKLIVVGVSGVTAVLHARARSTMGLADFGALTPGLLAPAAVGLWSVGLVLYLLLVSLILLRWLTVAMTPATLGPPTGS